MTPSARTLTKAPTGQDLGPCAHAKAARTLGVTLDDFPEATRVTTTQAREEP